MSKKSKNFEDSLKRLQEISELLESDEIALDTSIKLYEEGMKLSKECYKILEEAELKVQELNNDIKEELKQS